VNERIKELVRQAGLTQAKDFKSGDEVKNFVFGNGLEKFAELIISDVLDILADSKNFNKCVYTTFDSSQGQCITIELAKKIKEHFGNKQ
jgi:hypothetical protein